MLRVTAATFYTVARITLFANTNIVLCVLHKLVDYGTLSYTTKLVIRRSLTGKNTKPATYLQIYAFALQTFKNK